MYAAERAFAKSMADRDCAAFASQIADEAIFFFTGLVRDPQGVVIARFNSIWRREPGGRRRVVFDKGSLPEPRDRW